MAQRRHTLLIFSKVPEPGRVKTRLTALKDGWLSPEKASYLYHCMFFDVAEVCCAALDELEARHPSESFDLVISTTPPANLPKMKALFEDSGAWPRHIDFICDEGASFDEHYNDAFAQCWGRRPGNKWDSAGESAGESAEESAGESATGGDEGRRLRDEGAHANKQTASILSIGADMPALHRDDVVRGFEALVALLDEGVPGIVIAPDQEMGVSMVGWTRETPFDHTGVYYCTDGLTVLPAYIDKARKAELRAVYLPPIPDVDTMADLMHNITLVDALCYCAESGDATVAPRRTRAALESFGLSEVRVMPNDLRDPRDGIDFGAEQP